MKVVIFAGGYGTRIAEETHLKPKPMVEIGGKPILWHIMKIYSAFGINDFVICCGYKADVIKEYFASYFIRSCDVTFDLRANSTTVHSNGVSTWTGHLADKTMTGGRLKRARDYIGDETFGLTYGDCVGNVDISALIEAHRREQALVTLTAVQPPGRFGALQLHDASSPI